MQIIQDHGGQYYAFDDDAWYHFANNATPATMRQAKHVSHVPPQTRYYHVTLAMVGGKHVIQYKEYADWDPTRHQPMNMTATQVAQRAAGAVNAVNSNVAGSDPGDEQPDPPTPRPMNEYRITQQRDDGTMFEVMAEDYSLRGAVCDPKLTKDDIISIELVRRG